MAWGPVLSACQGVPGHIGRVPGAVLKGFGAVLLGFGAQGVCFADVDPAENSKNVVFAERVVIFGPLSLENNKNKVSTLILPELLRLRNKK